MSQRGAGQPFALRWRSASLVFDKLPNQWQTPVR